MFYLVNPNSSPIVVFNTVVGVLLTVFFLYQGYYTWVGYRRGEVVLPDAQRLHRYAFFVAAHNEEEVIGSLVRSMLSQGYPRELFDVFVVADACTDATAERAREAGAIVYERYDLARKGKSWVMDYGFRKILADYPGVYEGFLVFDADNVLSPGYLAEMNKAFDMGYLVVTSYRNSKNFDSSWISMSMTLNFLREARYINNARMHLGTSCTVSGTGWLVSTKIIAAMDGWNFHHLSEDHQFSAFCCANGIRIGYAPAEFFDEQPVDYRSSWIQRLRWAKGFYQVFFSYFKDLMRGIRNGWWAAYDEFVTLGPASILMVIQVFVNGTYLALAALSHGFLATAAEVNACAGSLLNALISMYLLFLGMGALTLWSERDHIPCKDMRKLVKAAVSFPAFMITYIPVNVVALFKHVSWVPTRHTFAMGFEDVERGSASGVSAAPSGGAD
ncbi:MAG: glycosyltransferase family 2 protein [Atopobiaceae bacterium]|nr:glycosyltransferase family 2 protein [Atopobiaceae bacterium]MCI1318156.1 glycosyltransferase family 2 protein [Atopobiaceae bacterium]MCI1388328.1 glycosyltransferase family 2 protein [Atopobiaceae bacterium]MCI1431422.1 glycosyltransferase family 2 protein [Atopobiaceae bacterium]MCI1469858.1 glycosyltransferase family 2 protein [Atopobiaceae bacterium]